MSQVPDAFDSSTEVPVVAIPVDVFPDDQWPRGEPTIRRINGKPVERLTRAKEILGEHYWTMLGLCLVAMIVGSLIPMGILLGAAMCGMHICYNECRSGRKPAFDHLIKGADYLGDSIVAMVVIVCISMLFMFPMIIICFILFAVGMAMIEQGSGVPVLMFVLAAAAYFLALVGNLLIHIPFVFVFPLIVDRKLNAMEAIKLSAKAAWKNFGALTWFLLGNMFSSLFAAMLCYVPAILLMPLNFAATFELYHEVFDDKDPLPEKTVPQQAY